MSPAETLKYTHSNGQVLLKALEEFKQLPIYIQWQPEWNEQKKKWLKRPLQKTNGPRHFSLNKVLSRERPVGLVCNQTHTLIALDIDGVPLTHPYLQALLVRYPTYVEHSPSGKPNHCRIIYTLPSVEDKQELKPKAVVPVDSNAIELYCSSQNFVTLTGAVIASNPIAEIPISELTKIFPAFKRPQEELPVSPVEEGLTTMAPATLTSINIWLREVPCDRDHPKVQNFINKHGYTYYDYWMLGLMALHATFGAQEGYVHAKKWSEGSADYDQEELQYKWKSLGKNTDITWRTYQHIFNECTIDWPVLQGKSKIPVPTEISNFQVWLQHHGLKICVDAITQTVFLDGPQENLKRYYRDPEQAYSIRGSDVARLAALMLDPCRDYKFRPSHKGLIDFIRTLASQQTPDEHINRFARCITETSWHPDDGDYIRMIGRDILQRDTECAMPSQEFHELLVRKWLLSLGRHFWPDELADRSWLHASAEGMLILSGEQGGIGKSSFGERLFPVEWRHLYTKAKPRLSSAYGQDKDYKMRTCTRIIVDYDEAERVYKGNDEADLKAEQTATYDIFRPPYSPDILTFPRRYSHMASTNQTSLTIPREGARRCWWINVSYVDTYALDSLDMMKLWAQIRYELAHAPFGQVPWLLTNAERKYLEDYLLDHRSENRWEMWLKDAYDFSPEGYKAIDAMRANDFECTSNRPFVWHITKGISQIAEALNVKPEPGLQNSVRDLVKRYAPAEFYAGKTQIKRGIVKWRKQTRYLMPIMRFDQF